jgi:hypothetical protein
MIAIVRDWHQTISWKLGFGHGKEGRAYRRPRWVNEAIYALAYTYARHVKIQTIDTPIVHVFSARTHETLGFAVARRHEGALDLR